jgi:hypothetical protein
MQEIIIVGNGTSVLEVENGSKIDTFKKVVRFNSYAIKDYEKYVGERTDIWFNVINFSNKQNEWRMAKKYDKIYLHSWQWDEKKDKLYKEFLEFYKDKNMLIEKTKRHTCVEMSEFIENKYMAFSTGAIAIWMMLKNYEMVTITGFDWWERKAHHYSDSAVRGNNHKPELEKILIDKLVIENKLKFL